VSGYCEATAPPRGAVAVDETEFSEFFASQYGSLCWLGLLLTGDRAEAEELAQEALVRTATPGLPLLRERPRGVSSQASELRERKIGITPFDCPCDKSAAIRSRKVQGTP